MKIKSKRIIALFIVFCSITIFTAACSCSTSFKQEQEDFTSNPNIVMPDLSQANDGTFSGSHKAGLVSADVEVELLSQVIKKVTLVNHVTLLGKPAEVIVDTVTAEQSVEVDTVSGATLSSLVILKAVQHALENSVQ